MTDDILESKIEEFRDIFLDKNWKWRKGQKDTIKSVINAYYDGVKVVILDCPTGSGKSTIALCVSWILNTIGKKGYILASDISLQEQYETDIKKFNMSYGSVKGIDNYLCVDNNEKHSIGTCRIRGTSPKSMHCYTHCPYFFARNFASKSYTAVLNYAYWLIMQNYVNMGSSDEILFPPRDFTVCDEAHKILDIVQNHYSPKFEPTLKDKLEKLTNFLDVRKIINNRKELQSIIVLLNLIKQEEDQPTLLNLLLDVKDNISRYLPAYDKMKAAIKQQYGTEPIPREWKEAIRLCEWTKDLHCKIEDFCDIITKTSANNLIKNPGINNDITFNCLEESYMMEKYFNRWTGFTVLMSATFADPTDYMKGMSIKSAKYVRMESTFNFEKSPIYFYNKIKLSYSNMEKAIPWIQHVVNEILDEHKNENGIIHSTSYNLTMKILSGLSDRNKRRILVYNGTEEKKQVLNVLKRDKSKVLMGPSILEGLDLKDNISRFQIFAKVPYLNLGDRFVCAKMKVNPSWYRQKAIISILQGIGRSVRHESDYAVTYFLDAALLDLIQHSRQSFPPDFYERLRVAQNS